MKKISRLMLVFVVLATVAMSSISVFAAEPQTKSNIEPSDFISVRENVSQSIAAKDTSFNAVLANKEPAISTRVGATWNVVGIRSWNSDHTLSRPTGYSQHKKDNTVLNTYHYTRTFLGSTSNPKGDSGRIWGTGTVWAYGTYCDNETWFSLVHKVYYGTSN